MVFRIVLYPLYPDHYIAVQYYISCTWATEKSIQTSTKSILLVKAHIKSCHERNPSGIDQITLNTTQVTINQCLLSFCNYLVRPGVGDYCNGDEDSLEPT